MSTERGETAKTPPAVFRSGQARGKNRLAEEVPDPLVHFLIAGMSVDHRRQRASMPREPLREEEIPGAFVDDSDGPSP